MPTSIHTVWRWSSGVRCQSDDGRILGRLCFCSPFNFVPQLGTASTISTVYHHISKNYPKKLSKLLQMSEVLHVSASSTARWHIACRPFSWWHECCSPTFAKHRPADRQGFRWESLKFDARPLENRLPDIEDMEDMEAVLNGSRLADHGTRAENLEAHLWCSTTIRSLVSKWTLSSFAIFYLPSLWSFLMSSFGPHPLWAFLKVNCCEHGCPLQACCYMAKICQHTSIYATYVCFCIKTHLKHPKTSKNQ